MAQAFDEAAQKRGFYVTDKPYLGVNALYGDGEWEIGSTMVTMFPDTTVTIMRALNAFFLRSKPRHGGYDHKLKKRQYKHRNREDHRGSNSC